MSHCLTYRVVRIPFVQADVISDEVRRAVAGKIIFDVVEVGAVGNRIRGLVTLLPIRIPHSVDKLIEVALGKVMGLEEPNVVCLLGEEESPEIPSPSIRGLCGGIDYAKMKIMRILFLSFLFDKRSLISAIKSPFKILLA